MLSPDTKNGDVGSGESNPIVRGSTVIIRKTNIDGDSLIPPSRKSPDQTEIPQYSD